MPHFYISRNQPFMPIAVAKHYIEVGIDDWTGLPVYLSDWSSDSLPEFVNMFSVLLEGIKDDPDTTIDVRCFRAFLKKLYKLKH